MPGVHVVSVTFNNQEIPQSPIKVLIEPDVDVGRIQVSGIEPSKSMNSYNIQLTLTLMMKINKSINQC